MCLRCSRDACIAFEHSKSRSIVFRTRVGMVLWSRKLPPEMGHSSFCSLQDVLKSGSPDKKKYSKGSYSLQGGCSTTPNQFMFWELAPPHEFIPRVYWNFLSVAHWRPKVCSCMWVWPFSTCAVLSNAWKLASGSRTHFDPHICEKMSCCFSRHWVSNFLSATLIGASSVFSHMLQPTRKHRSLIPCVSRTLPVGSKNARTSFSLRPRLPAAPKRGLMRCFQAVSRTLPRSQTPKLLINSKRECYTLTNG